MGIFDGLRGYEKLMLVCGFVLFLFALAVIGLMIAQRRDFAMVLPLIVLAIVLMGFPGIQAVKFSKGVVEIDRIRTQPPAATPDPQQVQQHARTLASVAARAAGDSTLLAKVADGYRAIGDLDKAYGLARSVLAHQPPLAVHALLVPVLAAKLEQATAALIGATGGPDATQRQEVATLASQLQSQDSALPASAHAALAKAHAALGDPQRVAANAAAAPRTGPTAAATGAPPSDHHG